MLEATRSVPSALPAFSARADDGWLIKTTEALRHVGCAVVTDVLSSDLVAETRDALYRVQGRIHQELGVERLERAGEMGVLRLPMKYDPHFFRLLEIPEMLQIVDATVSPTAILHLQNGFILPSFRPGETPKVFQNKFHMDFPRVLNGYTASINVMISIDPFTAENGGTLAVAGTHHKLERPDEGYLQANAVPVECGPGSLLVFDSTLWHAAGQNLSGQDRLAVNHQFTRSWIKQQMDYVRALGNDVVQAQPPRTQQLLGWYTRVVTSLDEYYRPADERLYRSGQG
jgi:ectoine hydroxylase-related dioxygenase (phytanoyl-CoA dioxygenase family)